MTTALAIPTVHLNGTSRDELLKQLVEAHQGVSKAMEMLGRAAPNGRDYYVQEAGAFTQAQNEHRARMMKLNEVAEELMTIAEAL